MGSDTLMENEPVLRLPIRIHWSLTVLMVLVNALIAGMVLTALLGVAHSKPPGLEWLGAAFGAFILGIVDILVLPMYRRHYVELGEHRLTVVLGVHRASTNYDDLKTVSEKIPASAGYVWKPTAPDPVRIHGRVFDEAVALADKELLYEELPKRNPRIKVIRKEER